MSTRICSSCLKKLPEKNFEQVLKNKTSYFRTICHACKVQLANRKKSATPEAFLRHLLAQLKYSRKKKNPELGWSIDIKDLMDRWHLQDGRCALSNILMTYA